MVFRGSVVNQITDRWQKSESDGTQKTPAWVWFPAVVGIFLMTYTWYLHFTRDVEHSWILACILTITILDLSRRMYNHSCFKSVYYDEHIEDIWRTAVLNVVLALGGLMLLYMGLFVY